MAKANTRETFTRALGHHQAGDLRSAEPLYRRVLAADPRHADAQNLLATLLLQSGKLPEALDHAQQATALAPRHFIAHNTLGHIYHDLGALDKAIVAYRRALDLKADFVEAQNNLGSALRESGDLQEAEQVLSQLNEQAPDYPQAAYNLGLVHVQQNRWQAALSAFQRAVTIDPRYAAAWCGLGDALREAKQGAQARQAYERALALVPQFAEPLYGLGVLACREGDVEKGLAYLNRAIDANPQRAATWAGVGSARQQQGQTEEAIAAYRRALELKEDYPEVWCNLAYVYQTQGKLDEALAASERALRIDPEFLPARINRGAILVRLCRWEDAERELLLCLERDPHNTEALLDLGGLYDHQQRKEEALRCYERGLAVDPNHAFLHWNRGLVLLSIGRIAQGWQEYDWGTQTKERALAQRYPHAMWKGEPPAGKTILVYAEQGLGDEVLFASCFPDLVRRAGRCIIQCEPRLAPLFARSFPDAIVHGGPRDENPAWLEPLGNVDYQCPAGSLPRYLRPSLHAFPDHNAFLRADPGAVARWRERLDALGPGLKVGIAWRSGLRNALRAISYTEILEWQEIFAVSNVHFINLQYGDCAAELDEVKAELGVTVHQFPQLDLFKDLDGSAALIDALDLVIAVATSTYNFAAGLGKPVWLLMPPGQGWVHLGTQHFPWYPSLRPFTKREVDDWQPAMAEVANALRQLVRDGAHAASDTVAAPAPAQPASAAHPPQDDRDALALHQRGSFAQAEALYRQQLLKQPDDVQALTLLGTLYGQTGNFDQACSLLERAAELAPATAAIFNNLGFVYHQMGRAGDEIAAYTRALRCEPSLLDARYNLGVAYLEKRCFDEAVGEFTRLIEQQPSYRGAYLRLGKALAGLACNDAAESAYRRALAADPNDADAHHDLGHLLYSRGEIAEAAVHFRAALAVRGDFAEALVNLGGCCTDQEEAVGYYDRALALRPDLPAAHHNRALALLGLGQLEEGWREWSWRVHDSAGAYCRAVLERYPLWQGEDLRDKTILVHAEQGLGDEILFASCLPQLVMQARRVILQCDQRLAGLFQRSFPAVLVHGGPRNEDLQRLAQYGTIDCQCPAGTLPVYLRRRIEEFPADNAYLKADPLQVARWRARLAALGSAPKVGIVWRSSLRTALRNAGYTDLQQWHAVLQTPGVCFVNLQYGDCQDELQRVRDVLAVDIHGFDDLDLYNDLDGATALMAALDLIIAVGVSTYNFAAALGKPTWLLTPPGRGWVNLGLDSIPWYPSLRLFQQARSGDWGALLKRIAGELDTFQRRSGGEDEPGIDPAAAMEMACQAFVEGKAGRAKQLFAGVLARDPGSATAMYNLGNCCYQEGDFAQARLLFARALALAPDNVAARENLAAACFQQQDWLAAIEHWEAVLHRDASRVLPLDSLATAYVKAARPRDAIRVLQKALALADTPQRRSALGWACLEAGEVEAAVGHFDAALADEPQNNLARYNRGLAKLAIGNLAEGWVDVAARFDVDASGAKRSLAYDHIPRWQGQDLRGKTLLAYAEQGVGDEVLFASCLPDVLRGGARCLLQCDARLAPLFARSFPAIIVHGGPRDERADWLQGHGAIDYQCPIGDLARYYRARIEDFPQQNAFLRADPRRVTFWRDKLAALGPGLKVGIVWRSGLRNPLRDRCYTQLAQDWGEVFAVHELCFVNLQYGDCTSELADVVSRHGVRVHSFPELDLYNALDDSAALVAALDLVITVATSTYNIAGGLGQRTWLLLPKGRGWVHAGTDAIPWYPSVKVFEQTDSGAWRAVIEQASAALRRLVVDLRKSASVQSAMARAEVAAEPLARIIDESAHPLASLLKALIRRGQTVLVSGQVGALLLRTADAAVGARGRVVVTGNLTEVAAHRESNIVVAAATALPLLPVDVAILGEGESVDTQLIRLAAMLARDKPIVASTVADSAAGDYLTGFMRALCYAHYDLPQLHRVAAVKRALVYFPAVATRREQPSARYVQLLQYYQKMHVEGCGKFIDGATVHTDPGTTFGGWQLPHYARPIRALLRLTDSRSILDYGAGKGLQYQWPLTIDGERFDTIERYWNIDQVFCYEPGLAGSATLPEKRFDGVVCTDVLEHIPEEDLPWVVQELFAFADRFVFASIACYPAAAQLPDGENAHCTVRPPQWWRGLFEGVAASYPWVKFLIALLPGGDTADNNGAQVVWHANMPLPK
jgi:tetratricopeptide (TPR) repeat protein